MLFSIRIANIFQFEINYAVNKIYKTCTFWYLILSYSVMTTNNLQRQIRILLFYYGKRDYEQLMQG